MRLVFALAAKSALFPYTTLFRSAVVAPVDHAVKAKPLAPLVCSAVVPAAMGCDGGTWRSSGAGAGAPSPTRTSRRSEEHTSELQSRFDLVCRLLLEKKNQQPCGC